MRRLSLLVTLLFGLLVANQACRCGIVDFADRFCNADYGVLVQARDDGTVVGSDRIFKVRILTVYRSNEPFYPGVDRRHIYTSTEGSLCGITLEKGKYYVIGGQFRKTLGFGKLQMYAGLCVALKQFDSRPLYNQFQPPKCAKTSGQQDS